MKIYVFGIIVAISLNCYSIEMGKPTKYNNIPTIIQNRPLCSWNRHRVLKITPPDQSVIYLCQGFIDCSNSQQNEVGCLATSSGECPSADSCANSNDVTLFR